MELTLKQYERIQHLLPRQRGNVVVENLTFLRALQYIDKNGCCWRALPAHFGKWYTIYQRFRRWIDKGVFDRIEKELQTQVIDVKRIKALALDSTYVKVHPDGTGAPQKRGHSLLARVVAAGQRKSMPSSRMSICR
jgi:transposase